MNGFVKMLTYSGTDFCCLCVLQKGHKEVIAVCSWECQYCCLALTV